MTKIVRAYAITEPTLLQTINEDGWLSKIGQGLGLKGKQHENPAQPRTNAPDVAKPRADIEAADPLTHVVSAILNPVAHGQVRVVVRMSLADLSHLYLKDDNASHAKLAAALAPKPVAPKPAAKPVVKPSQSAPAPHAAPTDNDVRSMQQSEQFSLLRSVISEDDAAQPQQTPPPQGPTAQAPTAQEPAPKPAPTPKAKPASAVSTVVALKPGYKFSDLIKGAGSAQVSVLLDVPQQTYNAYRTATTPADKVNFLTQMFNHKYYAMAISNSAAAKIAPVVDKAAGDMEAEKAAINPGIIVNHPGLQTIKFAKKEWHEKYSDAHSKMTAPPPAPTPEKTDAQKDAEAKLAQSVADTNAAKKEEPAQSAGDIEKAKKIQDFYEPLKRASKKYRNDKDLHGLIARLMNLAKPAQE